ncbi:MAG TPA: MarR family transcriptional regulator [Marmoricola sp.]|nr:MarR family transcriptional regulator [Marmoricola sp.]
MTGSADRREAAIRSLEQEIGTLLRRVRRRLHERAVRVHDELNATSYLVLVTLRDHGSCRAADLAELFALDKGSVSRVVHQLLDLGLIVRAPDPADRRASILTASDEALRRIAAVREGEREQFDDRLTSWDPDDIEELAVRLSRFNAALSDPVPAGS